MALVMTVDIEVAQVRRRNSDRLVVVLLVRLCDDEFREVVLEIVLVDLMEIDF